MGLLSALLRRRWPRRSAGLEAGLQALIDEHLLMAFDRQLSFAKVATDRAWILDQDAGVLRLGDDMQLPVQALGSVSTAARSWRWAWANESIERPLTAKALEAAAIGRDRSIAVLTDPDVDLDRIVDGHLLALVTAGLLGADGYYRCPYNGGELFVLVELPPGTDGARESANARFTRVLSQALLDLPVGMTEAAVTGYAQQLGLPIREPGEGVEEHRDEPVVTFDGQGRLVDVRATLEDVDPGAGLVPATSRERRGVALNDWSDPAIEGGDGWLDAAGDSPIEIVRAYQQERHDWDRRAEAAGLDRWAECEAELRDLHARFSTMRPLNERDTSWGSPPSRNPVATRVLRVARTSADRVVISVEEDDRSGADLDQRFDIVALRIDGRWRLDDRIAVWDDERINGLL